MIDYWRMRLIEWYTRTRERQLAKSAWLLPADLAYWCAMRVMSNATTGKYGNTLVPDLLAMEALARWQRDHNPPKPPKAGRYRWHA